MATCDNHPCGRTSVCLAPGATRIPRAHREMLRAHREILAAQCERLPAQPNALTPILRWPRRFRYCTFDYYRPVRGRARLARNPTTCSGPSSLGVARPDEQAVAEAALRFLSRGRKSAGPSTTPPAACSPSSPSFSIPEGGLRAGLAKVAGWQPRWHPRSSPRRARTAVSSAHAIGAGPFKE
jgi:hypothetical protein